MSWMPNTFSPRALVNVQQSRAKALRVEHDGPKTEIQEWHAVIDMLNPDATEQFLDQYSKVGDLPAVIDGVEAYRSADEDE